MGWTSGFKVVVQHLEGRYVEYENHLKTRQYFAKDPHSSQPWGWQQHGDWFISLNAVVVRWGATFAVGGPADATIKIVKSHSSLTTLTPCETPVAEGGVSPCLQGAQWANIKSPYESTIGARA